MIKRILLIGCLLPLTVHAAENTESISGNWKGEGEFGFTSTAGNSDSQNLNASLSVTRAINKWKHTASLEALQAESANVTSADSLILKEKSEYQLGEKSYAFGKLRYEDDEFSGYDYQTSLAFGAGSRFIEDQQQLLDVSIGLGVRSLKDSLTNTTEDEGIVTADLIYKYKISQTATFSQTVLIESGDENTHLESKTALKTTIDGNLAAKISYLLKRNSDVPAGTEKKDEIVTVSLVYGF